jgi:membrane protein YdbS with pleckstrin-like domain
MNKIIVKEGPLVFLKEIIIMELVAIIFLYVVSLVQNYGQLFIALKLNQYVRYDVFILIVSSIFQLFYLIALFLNWYFSHYEIGEKEIIKKSGILFKRRKSVSLQDVASVEIYQSPISRIMNHATIILEHRNERITKIKNIPNFNECVHIIKYNLENLNNNTFKKDVKAMIKQGEGSYIEFKETLRHDAKKGETSKELERVAMKSIVGFLNADGGTLLIGIRDNGEIIGLRNDYKTLSKKNRDGFENHITMLIKTMIGLPFAKYVSTTFEQIDNEEVCVVHVKRGHKPAYLINHDKKEEFFARVGNSTQPFSMSEAEEYIKTRF